MTNSPINNNSATTTTSGCQGGGLGIFGGTGPTEPQPRQSELRQRPDRRVGGGGIVIGDAAALTLNRSPVNGNIASTDGGASTPLPPPLTRPHQHACARERSIYSGAVHI